MSPSRGLTATHTFTRLLSSQLPNQIYLSTSTSPHVNLSLEHHLFTTLPSSCRTLLLYRNTPSLILGRNQNPWLETSHSSLLRTRVQLLRRRSGGGTVYHDLGNTNYSVTVPTSEFDRDKHALMVSRALRNLQIPAAVNGRHDIVVLPSFEAGPEDPLAKKCSGSAYKLTRHRSYHHGTMLLNTDLSAVKQLLKSPARDIITARGVASVPSPVVNTKVTHEEFSVSVMREWEKLYGSGGVALVSEAEAKSVEEIAKGVKELKSEEWVYGQTPKFDMALPNGGKIGVDKGVVIEGPGDSLLGRKFGTQVVVQALQELGMGREEARRWAEEMVGGSVWGVNYNSQDMVRGERQTVKPKDILEDVGYPII